MTLEKIWYVAKPFVKFLAVACAALASYLNFGFLASLCAMTVISACYLIFSMGIAMKGIVKHRAEAYDRNQRRQ